MANIAETFTTFFEGWLDRQQSFLEQLLSLSSPTSPHARTSTPTTKNEDVPITPTAKNKEKDVPHAKDVGQAKATTLTAKNKDDECRQLIEQVLGHYIQYYQEKSSAANDDVFLFYSPPWFTTFERTFLWMSGFKPSLVFKFITTSVGDSLSDDQLHKINAIKVETRREENEIEEIMARIQENMAAPPLFNLMRLVGRLIDGEVTDLDLAMEDLKSAMQMVMEKADQLRGTVVWKVMQILSPEDNVKLLAGAAQFQLYTRRLGLQRDQDMAAAAIVDFE